MANIIARPAAIPAVSRLNLMAKKISRETRAEKKMSQST
jgi:hypothetical protein